MHMVVSDPLIRVAGGFAMVSAIISAFGIVFLIAMYVLFATSLKEKGFFWGLLNDTCVAIQYSLTIPIALALYRILSPNNPTLILIATVIGISAMLMVIALQLALIFKVLPFQKQVVWVSIGIVVGIGSWLLITGLVARSTERMPNSVLMSAVAVPYFGFPAWAVWLGQLLLGW